MPRYLVERTFVDGFVVPAGHVGQQILGSIISCNSDRNVTWIHSYVAIDAGKTFCLYEAPSPEAIRLAAVANSLPIDRITEISVLDPHAFHVSRAGPRIAELGSFPDELPGSDPYVDPVSATPATRQREERRMALFLDVHTLEGGVAAAAVADAHRKDLETQGGYGVSYLKYWVDEAAGKIFCLVEAETAEAANAVHREAHGLVAEAIYSVTEHN